MLEFPRLTAKATPVPTHIEATWFKKNKIYIWLSVITAAIPSVILCSFMQRKVEFIADILRACGISHAATVHPLSRFH